MRVAAAPHALVIEYDHAPDLDVYRAGLGQALPDVVLATARSEAEALQSCGPADVLVAKAHDVSRKLLDAMPRLRLIQSLTTGTDHLATVGLDPGVLVASGRGVHGPQMAELAFMMMLALTRDLRGLLHNQQAHAWSRRPQPLLRGKTVVVLGVGAIAEAFAARAACFGMRVHGVSASRSSAPFFDAIHPRERLRDAAALADYLVVLAPYTPGNRHLVDAGVIAALKPGAMLVNIARGGVIDEAAMIEALQEGRLSSAALDVFATEPLPPDSPLWDMPNVIVTPHIGGMSDRYAEDIMPLLVENIGAYAAGRLHDLRNVVAKGG
jgi:phosphoglycerate dehydrogenase-like enzyme